MPNKPWWEQLDDKIDEDRKSRKIMIIAKWILILAFTVGFFLFLAEMVKLGL